MTATFILGAKAPDADPGVVIDGLFEERHASWADARARKAELLNTGHTNLIIVGMSAAGLTDRIGRRPHPWAA